MTEKLIVVIGSGPGIGSSTAAHFASNGFNVALLSRNADRLKDDASRVSSAATAKVKVQTYPVDVGNHADLKKTLGQVEKDLGSPEVVLFNAARVAPSTFGEIPVERLSEDFQIMNVGLYVVAEWAIPLLASLKQQRPDSHPCFLMTGGGIWQYPLAPFFALSMQKAAQVNLAKSLKQIAGPKGVHVATISVNGPVKDEEPEMNAKNIAAQYWRLYGQEKQSWEEIIQVGDLEALNQGS